MAEYPTWKQLKALLDSDDLSKAEKKQLVLIAEENGMPVAFDGGDTDRPGYYRFDKLQEYEQKLGISDQFKENFTDNDEWGDIGDKYAEAKKLAKSNAEHNDDIENAKGSLQDAKNAAERGEYGGAGVKTSDQILDPARPALKCFEEFLPLYHTVKKIIIQAIDGEKVGDYKQAVKRYDEQLGIQFWKFSDQATEMKRAADALRGADTAMGKKLEPLFEHWKGSASRHAQDFYARQTLITENQVVAKIDDVGGVLDAANQHVAKAVRGKAEWVLRHLHSNDNSIAGKTRDEWYNTIKAANGSEDEDTLRRVASIWGCRIDDDCGLNDDSRRTIHRKAEQVVENQFCRTVKGAWDGFEGMCDRTRKSVDTAWSHVTDQAKKLKDDPYGPQRQGGDPRHPPRGHGSGGDHHRAGGAPAGGGTTSPAGAGVSPAGAGAGAAGGGGGGSFTPPAPQQTGGSGGITDPASAVPDPPRPGAAPGPRQAVPGGTVPGRRQDPETVTIRDGDGTIELTSPDGQGHMTLTVDDGSGAPKTYDVDFGAPAPGAPGAGAAWPGDGPASARDLSGTGGAGDATGPADAPQRVRADAGGSAVIHDGDETITVQRSADDPSQVAVTVDDGTGEPETYTVDYSTVDDEAGGDSAGGPAAPPEAGDRTVAASAAPAGVPSGTFRDAPDPGSHDAPRAPEPQRDGTPASGPAPTSTTPAEVTGRPGIASPAAGLPAVAAFAGGGPAGTGAAAGLSGMPALGGPGVASPAVEHPAGPAGPGIASPAHEVSGNPSGGGMMPMMGGMGAGGGQGGDSERGASQWRTTGDLFDDVGEVDEVTGFRAVNGILGEMT